MVPTIRPSGSRRTQFTAPTPWASGVAPDGLAAVVEGLRRVENFGGFIATVPHKIPMLALCDDATPDAHGVGAVNPQALDHRREPVRGDVERHQHAVHAGLGEQGVHHPHKIPMLALCDDATPDAHGVGAVNCVRRDPDGRMVGT
jgi:shikimate 5-dehydrogenase